MADLIVRPSTKLVKPFYFVALLLAAAIYLFGKTLPEPLGAYNFVYIVPALVVLFTAWRQFELRFTTLTVAAGKLRYESGMLSKSTRTMEIHKVQDVRVDQSIMQRMTGIGSISIETAGDSSRLTMHNVDRPQQVADRILEAAHQ